jgi:hypothetical protein
LTASPQFSTFAVSLPPNRIATPTSEVRVPIQVDAPPGAAVTKALSLLIIVLMLASIVYTASIVIRNWSAIGV